MRLNHFYSDKIDHNINLQCGNKTAIQIIFKYVVCLENLQYPSTCTNQFEYSCKSELYSRNKHVPSYNSVCSITYKLKFQIKMPEWNVQTVPQVKRILMKNKFEKVDENWLVLLSKILFKNRLDVELLFHVDCLISFRSII